MAFARRVRRLVNPRTRAVAKRKRRPKNPRAAHRRLSRAQIKAGFGGKRRQAAVKRRRPSNPARVVHRKPKTRVVTRYKTRVITRVVKAKQKRRKPRPSNPVLLTYGPALLNPNKKRRVSKMAKARKRKKRPSNPARRMHTKRRRPSNPVRVVYRYKRRRPKNPSTRSVRHRYMRRRPRNPINFGAGHGAVSTAKAVAAGLVGVTINKTIVGLLPATLVSSPLMRVAAAAIAAWGAGVAATKMMGSDVGGAVMFGGFMQAGSMALNAFVPSIGGVIGLNGLRGLTPSKDILLPYNMFGGMQGQFPAPGPLAAGGFTPAFAN